jgi:excisionase family DNA binding protein
MGRVRTPAVDDLPALMTVPTLAKFLGVSLARCYDLVHRESLAIYISQRNIRVDREALRLWLASKSGLDHE